MSRVLPVKSGYGALKDVKGGVIGAYLITLSSQESCDRNLVPVVFPDGARPLVSIDGAAGFEDIRARIEANACDGVSIRWAEACNTALTATRFGENGEILDPIMGGRRRCSAVESTSCPIAPFDYARH
ncbi:MAG TPA: hypothetical protein VHX19_12090 [Stellaceae bacterium]|nr:hypothetical protein [Stellaceae bacterium]